MTAWQHFDRMLAERAEKRRSELGLAGDIIAAAMEEVREAAREAFVASVADRPQEARGRTMIADGFSSVDQGWLQQAIVFIAASLAAIYYIKKTFFDKTTSVKIEGTIATTKYVDGKHDELKSGMGHLLTRETFLIHHNHAEEEREELKEAIKEAAQKFERFTTDSYRSRRELHRRVNSQQNALHFIAGQHERGAEIKRILDRSDSLDTGVGE